MEKIQNLPTNKKSEKSAKSEHHKCGNSLCQSEMKHLFDVIKNRYISPYKIIYMINQQEADLFKIRNQSSGCCSSSSITIPKHQMTKTQLFLTEAMNGCLKISNLNKILEQLSEKYQNIVKSGQKENLKVDDQVEKFLMQKVLSEGLNLHIYKIVVERLKKQNQSISKSAMLWATPNTWYAKYPNTPLNFLSPQILSNLNNSSKGYGLEKNFLKQYKDNLLKQMIFLERDGKFEELLWSKNFEHIRNDKKVMNFPQNYAIDGTQQSYRQGQLKFSYLKGSLLSLRSIPFELNQKCRQYCTISQNNQVTYYTQSLLYRLQKRQSNKYSTYCVVGSDSICFTLIKGEQLITQTVRQGDLLITDNNICHVTKIEASGDKIFMFKSWISTLDKKQ